MRLFVLLELVNETDGFTTACAELSEGELARDVIVFLTTYNQTASSKS